MKRSMLFKSNFDAMLLEPEARVAFTAFFQKHKPTFRRLHYHGDRHHMNFILKFAALAGVLAATGCGTAPANLSVPKSLTQLELRENFVYSLGKGNGSVKTETTLAAGLYTATYADSAGVYHKGPPQCFKVKVIEQGWVYPADKVGHYAVSADCGFYVFNDPAIPPKLFWVLGTDTGFFAPTAPKNARSSINAAGVVTDNQPHLKATSAGAGVIGSVIGSSIVDAASSIERGHVQILEGPLDREALRKALVNKALPSG